jgi:hypothetical protein
MLNVLEAQISVKLRYGQNRRRRSMRTITLDESIKREEALAYSFGERWKRLGEPVGDLPELEEEHKQMAEWLKELKAYEEAREEIGCLPIVWEEGAGIRKCIDILDKHLKEVNADDE